MIALKLLKTGVELEDGEPRFCVRINMATMGTSEAEAVNAMLINVRNNLHTLALQIEAECSKRLTKLYGVQPCSEFTPRNCNSAFMFNSKSCLEDKW